MRAKALLLAAAVSAAALTAVSAATYSVNVVGYVNTPLNPGFSLVAVQLQQDDGDYTIGKLIANPVPGLGVFIWNGTGFDSYEYLDLGGGVMIWNPSDQGEIALGRGAFINNPTAAALNMVVVGQVAEGADSNITIPANFNIVSSIVPQKGTLDATAVSADYPALDYPATAGDGVFKWNGTGYDSFELLDLGGGTIIWNPATPTVEVGEAFFANNASGAEKNWDRNFQVPRE